jgi:hypothetical protein
VLGRLRPKALACWPSPTAEAAHGAGMATRAERGHCAPATRGGTTVGGSPLAAQRRGLLQDDKGTSGVVLGNVREEGLTKVAELTVGTIACCRR